MKFDYKNDDWTEKLIGEDENLTEKQKNIIKTTALLFMEKGYEATSTKEISKLAGVAEGTIFKQYSTKKELLLEVVSRIMKALVIPVMITGIDEIIEGEYEKLDDFFYRFIRNRVEVIKDAAPLLRILIQEMPFHKEIRQQLLLNMTDLPYNRLFDKLKAKNFIIDISNDELFKLIISTVGGYIITHYVIFPEFFNEIPEKELENLVDFIVRGIRKYE
ncbi:MAG: TetR/AcrR family transcriptional regulator [Proteocatella sp.]